MRAVRSLLPVARVRPSGPNAMLVTVLKCPSMFHNLTVPSRLAVAR